MGLIGEGDSPRQNHRASSCFMMDNPAQQFPLSHSLYLYLSSLQYIYCPTFKHEKPLKSNFVY